MLYCDRSTKASLQAVCLCTEDAQTLHALCLHHPPSLMPITWQPKHWVLCWTIWRVMRPHTSSTSPSSSTHWAKGSATSLSWATRTLLCCAACVTLPTSNACVPLDTINRSEEYDDKFEWPHSCTIAWPVLSSEEEQTCSGPASAMTTYHDQQHFLWGCPNHSWLWGHFLRFMIKSAWSKSLWSAEQRTAVLCGRFLCDTSLHFYRRFDRFLGFVTIHLSTSSSTSDRITEQSKIILITRAQHSPIEMR